MENIFVVGGQAQGKAFIGRKDLLNKFKDLYLKNKKVTRAIIGITRIGKTSFVKQVFKDFPSNILIIEEDLNEWSTYYELWQDICLQITKFINRNFDLFDDDAIEILEDLEQIQQDDINWVKFNRKIKDIFEYLNDNNVRTIMILDEFDNAQKIFSEGTKHFELFRILFTDSKYNISAVTISRRQLSDIEGTTYMSSTFHGILDPIYFKGFNSDDLKEYFEVFKNNDIKLSAPQISQIEYYAGNMPFLLSIIGHYVIESYEFNHNNNISDIVENKCKAINDYYRDCIKHLERDDNLAKLLPFTIGPNINVSQNERDEMINLGYLKVINNRYIAISEHFMTFLKTKINNNTWENIINLEKAIKTIIGNQLVKLVESYRVFGSDLNQVEYEILNKTPRISENDLLRYSGYIRNTYKTCKINADYLDVMSLTDCVKVIDYTYEEIFKQFFGDQDKKEVIYQLEKCGNARNPIAHGHEIYINESDRAMINSYCDNFLKVFRNTTKNCHTVLTEDFKQKIINASKKFK